jgi:ABC-type cobalamin/Fe3+-siderophores transport system ATPase subunit
MSREQHVGEFLRKILRSGIVTTLHNLNQKLTYSDSVAEVSRDDLNDKNTNSRSVLATIFVRLLLSTTQTTNWVKMNEKVNLFLSPPEITLLLTDRGGTTSSVGYSYL